MFKRYLDEDEDLALQNDVTTETDKVKFLVNETVIQFCISLQNIQTYARNIPYCYGMFH